MTARGPIVLAITFGPSRSANYRRALAYARRWANEVTDLEPGRHRATFHLHAADPLRFVRAARVLAYTMNWRSTEVDVEGEPEVPYVVESMLWCGGGYANAYGRCTFRFFGGVYPKCHTCPLFDAERADLLIGEAELSRGRPAPSIAFDPDEDPDLWAIPDHLPEDWGKADS